MTVIIFLIVLAVLVFVHELGHFLFAKWSGIRVDAFALGFGPKLFSWTKGETTYRLNLIPFGGYVKIFGENPDDKSLNGPDSARSFVHKNRFRQVAVLFAGVLFNFVFAWLIYVSVFTTGITVSTQEFADYSKYFKNERVIILEIKDGSPAEKAGLKIGDVPLDFKSVKELQDTIASGQGKPFSLKYLRDNKAEQVLVTPVKGIIDDKYAIGIAMNEVADANLPFLSSVWIGLQYTGIMIHQTAFGLFYFVTDIFRGHADFSSVAGPIGIAGIVGSAADVGFTYLLMITALISINLGVINLIPFPALDGGRILFVLIEGIIRRPIPAKFTNTVNLVGFALLMLLMVVVTFKDVLRLMR